MLEYTTGNQTVDEMATMQLTGNVIPQIWYKQIVRDNGKPHLLAISILADVVYWYRPTELRDPGSGQFLGFRKKFAGDLLQRSYQQIADQFGESKRSVTDAIVRLERIGVLTRVFRTVTVNGTVFNNVLYLELNPEKLYEITFPKSEEMEREIPNPEESAIPEPETEEMMEQENSPDSEEITGTKRNMSPPPTKFRERGHVKKGEGSQNFGTRNTKNTIENTHIYSSSSHSHSQEYDSVDEEEKLLKNLLGYEKVIKQCSPDLVQEIFREIKKEPGIRDAMTAELFLGICQNIQYYAPEILNTSAYIRKCLENIIAGKQISEMIKADGNRGRPYGGAGFKNQFNHFPQNTYDFESVEREMIHNDNTKDER